jgi:hypothetical protein
MFPKNSLLGHKPRAVPLETYVDEILAQQATAASAKTPRVRTPEQIREWLDSLAQLSDKIPALPDAISHEWIYQDHE